MRCRKAQKFVSLAVDGELDARRTARLERHMRDCAACRTLFEDFRGLAAEASNLRGPEPSEAVWMRIRARLTAPEGRPAAEGIRAWARPHSLWLSPALRYAGAAALALVIIVSAIIIGLRPGPAGAPAGLGERERYTLAKLDEAERHYQQAIQALSEAFSAQKGVLAPQVVEMFEQNLAVVDATIQACRQAVLEEPEDLQARSFLLAAYMNKVTLLDSALDIQRRSPEAIGTGTTL